MSWLGIEGHDRIVEQLRRSLGRNRLPSTMLFVGPAGVGKRTFALRLAQSLLCTLRASELLDPCGVCDACAQVLAGTHPDLDLIAKPADRSFIPVSMFIGEGDQRLREGLCHRIALRPFMGGRKIAIIDDADCLNEEGANCLLKTLEEPPPRSLLILIGTSAEKQLPTIRSRSQIVRFQPLEPRAVAEVLLKTGAITERPLAERLAAYSEGSIERALALADEDLWSFREQMFSELSRLPAESVRVAQSIASFVDAAGKEASDRRDRARQVVAIATQFYSGLMRATAGMAADADPQLKAAISRALDHWSRDPERVAQCVDRCIEALAHIDRNANQATLIEAWVDDLRGLSVPAQAG